MRREFLLESNIAESKKNIHLFWTEISFYSYFPIAVMEIPSACYNALQFFWRALLFITSTSCMVLVDKCHLSIFENTKYKFYANDFLPPHFWFVDILWLLFFSRQLWSFKIQMQRQLSTSDPLNPVLLMS